MRQNFWARPLKTIDGSTNIFRWTAGIPGKEGVSLILVLSNMSKNFLRPHVLVRLTGLEAPIL